MLPTTSPESVGMSSERVQRAFGILKDWLAEGACTAIASVIARNGKIIGEYYGGKVAPTFPKWLIDGTKPSRLAWYLKERVLPPLYWQGMLKGREWMAQPEMVG